MLMITLALKVQCVGELLVNGNQPHPLQKRQALASNHTEAAHAACRLIEGIPQPLYWWLMLAVCRSGILSHCMSTSSNLSMEDVLGELQEGLISFLKTFKSLRIISVVDIPLQN